MEEDLKPIHPGTRFLFSFISSAVGCVIMALCKFALYNRSVDVDRRHVIVLVAMSIFFMLFNLIHYGNYYYWKWKLGDFKYKSFLFDIVLFILPLAVFILF